MNIFKKMKPRMSTSKQRMKASELLTEIAEMTSLKEATYYEVNLLPRMGINTYDYETYIKLLEEVKHEISCGCRARTSQAVVLANARIKVLT